MAMAEPHSFKAWSHSHPPFPSTLTQLSVTPPKPADLKPNEILVEVHTAALNPCDVQLANLPIFNLAALNYPKGLGCDFAGVVLGKGSAVKKFPVGSEVMGVTQAPLSHPTGGTLSQIAVVDVSRTALTLKPPHLSWSEAAALPLVYLTARTITSPPYLVLPPSASPDPTSKDSHAVQPTVVVLGGSSAVGQYAIQLLRLKLHARVIATCSARNAEFVKSLGADVVIDYTTEDVGRRLEELRPEEGYVEIVDCVGGTELLERVPGLLAPKSREYRAGGNYVTIVGDKTSRASLGGAMTYLWNPSMVVRMLKGWLLSSYRYNCVILTSRSDWLDDLSHLTHPSANKNDSKSTPSFQIPIDSEWSFDDVPKAYEKLNEGRASGKIVVKVKKPATGR